MEVTNSQNGEKFQWHAMQKWNKNKSPNNMETQRTENNKSDPGLKKILPEVSQYRFQSILQSHSDKTSKIFICIKIETAS